MFFTKLPHEKCSQRFRVQSVVGHVGICADKQAAKLRKLVPQQNFPALFYGT